jgi:beta-N-acetylhexosaminidase
MNLDRAILTHFSPGFGGTRIPDWLIPWLKAGLGGVTLFSSNCPSMDETSKLIAELRSYSPRLIISIDEEGGDVTRLFVKEGSPFPTPALLGRCDNLDLTYGCYLELGKILRSIGIDMSFAPVVDVVTSDKNPIIGVRAFGRDFETVARHSVAAVNGFHDAGIAACIKHFPGHGGVAEDSHHDLPTLPGSLDELTRGHLAPYISSIGAHVQSIMVGHIITPALDSINPASCSRSVITDYLKGELGFTGLVVTDALDMGALGGPKVIAHSAKRAIEAGADLLCFSGLYDQSNFISTSFEAIKQAVLSGEIDSAELIENAKRISTWRPEKPVGSSAPYPLPLDSIEAGMVVKGSITLSHPAVHLVEMSADPTIAAGFVAWGMRRSLAHAGIKVKLETSDVSLRTDDGDQLVVAFRDAFRDKKILASLERLSTKYPEAIFVDMGWPTEDFQPINLVRTYGSCAIASDVAATLMLANLIN